jgi:site-specific DNA-methyltransferase (adenine-specific)
LVFYKKLPSYNPQMTPGLPYQRGGYQKGLSSIGMHKPFKTHNSFNETGLRYPKSVLKFTTERGLHSCQKPVALLEWLVKTYSNESDLVLDATMGSASTAVAAHNTGRRFIGFEINADIYQVARNRVCPLAENNRTDEQNTYGSQVDQPAVQAVSDV